MPIFLNDIPFELRRMIWRDALLEESTHRFVMLTELPNPELRARPLYGIGPGGDNSGQPLIHVKPTMPLCSPLLSATRESREAALGFYTFKLDVMTDFSWHDDSNESEEEYQERHRKHWKPRGCLHLSLVHDVFVGGMFNDKWVFEDEYVREFQARATSAARLGLRSSPENIPRYHCSVAISDEQCRQMCKFIDILDFDDPPSRLGGVYFYAAKWARFEPKELIFGAYVNWQKHMGPCDFLYDMIWGEDIWRKWRGRILVSKAGKQVWERLPGWDEDSAQKE
jgi:hypothetical protein